jgi:hypothetical protein
VTLAEEGGGVPVVVRVLPVSGTVVRESARNTGVRYLRRPAPEAEWAPWTSLLNLAEPFPDEEAALVALAGRRLPLGYGPAEVVDLAALLLLRLGDP